MEKVAAEIPTLYTEIAIGPKLGSRQILPILEYDKHEWRRSYREVFQMWQSNTENDRTWKTLLDVLRTKSVGQPLLADTLESQLE